VDATPVLAEVGRALAKVALDAVLIGNAAAALQGAPVTTVDLDFCFRKTPGNLRKIKRLADLLKATVLHPFYPVSDLYRLHRDEDGLQVDFMPRIHGIRSFEGLRDRSTAMTIGGVTLRVAALADIIKSKRAAGRPRDRAVLEILVQAHEQASVSQGQRSAPRARTRKRPGRS
jgi:hypothetical protein